MIDLELLKQAVLESRDGITIAEADAADHPLIFVNPAFERLTGYSAEEVLNRNCRFLQKDDRDYPELDHVRRSIGERTSCVARLRNYRKDGSLFWNELSLAPIRDHHGKVTHFIGIQKDITARVVLEQQLQEKNRILEETTTQLERLATLDGLTGIYNRRFFDNQFDIQWRIAARNRETVALMLIDIDYFKKFNDTYGHQAGDEALRQVAASLAGSFLRGADFVARYGGEEFVVLSAGMSAQQAHAYTAQLCDKVRALEIPHSASACGFLTVSIGFAVTEASADGDRSALLQDADRALYRAKGEGRDRTIGASAIE